jgi:phosphohistidine swiveling domain-containing protein
MSYGYDAWELTDEEKDLRGVWLLNMIFATPPLSPLYFQEFITHFGWGLYYAADYFSFPMSRGWDLRDYNGFIYCSISPTREEEREQRERKFRERLAPFIEDCWGMWIKYRDDFIARWEPLGSQNVEQMSDGELGYHLLEIWALLRKLWEDHMITAAGPMAAHQAFHRTLTELTGIHVTDPLCSKAMAGFDNTILDISRKVAGLASRSFELGLEDNFKLPDEEVLPAMKQSEAGQKWLEEFQDFLDVWGWRSSRLWEFCVPTWKEKPEQVIEEMRPYIESEGKFTPDIERDRVIKEREEAEKEILAKVSLTQREALGKLLRSSQQCCRYMEDHNWWYEFRTNGLFRRAALELGNRMAKYGALDEPEDVFCLCFDDLIKSCVPQEMAPLKYIARKNKEEWKKALNTPYPSDEIPLMMGDPSFIGKYVEWDPLFSESFAPRVEDPDEVGAICTGGAGAPGIAEGIARVIISKEEWDQLQVGEILVAPSTDSTWTSRFGLIKGVVTDGGGALSHPTIISREYGIPCVSGTMDATQKIKTGDKIKVDGNLLRVYLLESEE